MYVRTVHVTNFVSDHDAEQETVVLVDAGSLRRVAGRGDVSQTHQVAIGLLRANVVPESVHDAGGARRFVRERLRR